MLFTQFLHRRQTHKHSISRICVSLKRKAPCNRIMLLALAKSTFSVVPSQALPHSQKLYGALPQPGRARENFGKRCDSLAAFATTLGNDATTPWGGVGEG